MGFFDRVKASSTAMSAIGNVKDEYSVFRTQNPKGEAFDFMLSSWRSNSEKADKLKLAFPGTETVKYYACLPSPLCVQMLAHHTCFYFVSGFSETYMAKQWNKTIQEVSHLGIVCDADRLNELFQSFLGQRNAPGIF